jgi:hypothetical protein
MAFIIQSVKLDMNDPERLQFRECRKGEAMSWIHEVSAEELAALFERYREALAQDFERPREEDKDRPAGEEPRTRPERRLMVAAARLALQDLSAKSVTDHRKYFAAPGEAEWGC